MASKQRNEKQISLLLYSTWTHTVVPLENFQQIFMGRQKCQAKVINQACKIQRAAFCQKFYFSASPINIWFPGLMCFAISFAASSTCWHWKGDCPVPNTKSLFHCHIPASAAFGKGVGSSRPSQASIQPSPVLASGPSWMSNVLWTEIWPLLSWAVGTGSSTWVMCYVQF